MLREIRIIIDQNNLNLAILGNIRKEFFCETKRVVVSLRNSRLE